MGLEAWASSTLGTIQPFLLGEESPTQQVLVWGVRHPSLPEAGPLPSCHCGTGLSQHFQWGGSLGGWGTRTVMGLSVPTTSLLPHALLIRPHLGSSLLSGRWVCHMVTVPVWVCEGSQKVPRDSGVGRRRSLSPLLAERGPCPHMRWGPPSTIRIAPPYIKQPLCCPLLIGPMVRVPQAPHCLNNRPFQSVFIPIIHGVFAHQLRLSERKQHSHRVFLLPR